MIMIVSREALTEKKGGEKRKMYIHTIRTFWVGKPYYRNKKDLLMAIVIATTIYILIQNINFNNMYDLGVMYCFGVL